MCHYTHLTREERERVGDWEDDTVVGPTDPCLVTLVDRGTRFLCGGKAASRASRDVAARGAVALSLINRPLLRGAFQTRHLTAKGACKPSFDGRTGRKSHVCPKVVHANVSHQLKIQSGGLEPFDATDAALMLPAADPVRAVELYSLVGGVPLYLEQLDAGRAGGRGARKTLA